MKAVRKQKSIYKFPIKVERKYYKYVESEFVQPVLTENGILGGNSFACTASSAIPDNDPANRRGPVYFAFNGTNTFAWHSERGFPQWIEFYNPVPLIITNIQITNWSYPNSTGMTGGRVEASNNNYDWDILTNFTNSNTAQNGVWNIVLSSNNNAYKYYRIVCTSSNYNNYSVIGEISISAKEKNIVESNISNYDFFKDITKYYAINN